MIFGDPNFGNSPLERDVAIHAVNFFDLLPSKAISPNDKAALITGMPLGFLASWVLSNFTDREIVPVLWGSVARRWFAFRWTKKIKTGFMN